MKTKQPQLKQRRAETILGYFEAIAKAYDVDPEWIITKHDKHGSVVDDARCLIVYHLHCCGLTYMTISRMIQRSKDGTRKLAHRGRIALMDADRALLASLPKLEKSDKKAKQNAW